VRADVQLITRVTEPPTTAVPAPASTDDRAPLLIYTRVGAPDRLSIGGRILAGSIALACLSVLIAAVKLNPSATGVATHTAMGFDECQFLKRTGLPCPSCGMTTSFAWYARGNALASLYVQPMAFLLALLFTAAVWAGAYIALTGKPAHRLLRLIPSRYYLLPIMLFAALAWGWKMFIHVRGIDGWG
jgi:hypothetical protein